jgi:hypothetical protein
MRTLYLDLNLGLGDAIICNGLVRTLAKQKREIIVPSYAHNLPTVRHMFSDLQRVEVRSVVGDGSPGPFSSNDEIPEILSIGMNYHGPIHSERWDEAFYLRAGVPFDAKWNAFFVPESGTEISPTGAYLLEHQDRERGFVIDFDRLGVPISPRGMGFIWEVLPSIRALITDWRFVIEGAVEIHCIDSSFMHLAELLPTTGKLFYHKYARAQGSRQHTDAVLRKKWTVYE